MSTRHLVWKKVCLGDLAEYLNGAAFKPSDWEDAGVPIIRIQNLTDRDKAFNRTTRSVDERLLVRNEDILVSWSATLDAFIWDRGEAWLNQHIFRVLPKEAIVDKDYLFYILKSEIAALRATEHLHGSTMKHINRGPFLAHKISLPPLTEQRRIVVKLRSLLGRSISAHDELSHIPKLAVRYKQSMLAAAFRGDLTAGWRTANGGDAWHSETLGNLALDVRYGTAAKCHYEPKATPVLRIPNMAAGRIDISDLKYGAFDAREVARLALRQGDLLVIRSNGSPDLVGRIAIVDEPAVGYLFAGYLIRLRLDAARVLPDFVALAFEAPMVRRVVELFAKSTSGVHNINSEQLRSLEIPLPSLAEQHEIVRSIRAKFLQIDTILDETTKAIALVDRLDRGFLARAFSGELIAPGLAITADAMAAAE